jgi:hypothetical protein
MNKPVSTRAPKLCKLAHDHGKNVTRRNKSKRQLCDNVMMPLPLIAQVLPVGFIDVDVMVTRFQVDGEQQVLRKAELQEHPDGLVHKLRDLKE